MIVNSGMDRMMYQMIKNYGWDAAIKHCRNLGIDFYSTYYMVFGRLPRTDQF